MSQSVIEDFRQNDDQFSKANSLKNQEEYIQYLKNQQKIREMEDQMNRTFSHNLSPSELLEVRQPYQNTPGVPKKTSASGSAAGLVVGTKVINESNALAATKGKTMTTHSTNPTNSKQESIINKTKASLAASRMLNGSTGSKIK